MNTISAFASRCRDALAEYLRLKAEGYSHEDAHRLSRMGEAITGKIEPRQDLKRRQAGDDK